MPADGATGSTALCAGPAISIRIPVLVTAAQTASGEKIVVALPLATGGVTIGNHFELLALDSTASSSLKLDGVHVAEGQILSRDIDAFPERRPADVSRAAVGHVRRVGPPMPRRGGVESGRRELRIHRAIRRADNRTGLGWIAVTSFAATVGSPTTPTKHELLTLRLAAADVVSAAAALEIRTAGGKGYARRTDASRRFREAAFIPVQSPSEAQLRWELRTGR